MGLSVVEDAVAVSVATEPVAVGQVAITVSVNCEVAPLVKADAVQVFPRWTQVYGRPWVQAELSRYSVLL